MPAGSTKRLKLTASAGATLSTGSQSSLSGNMDVTFYLSSPVAQGTNAWDCPRFQWCTNSSGGDAVGYRIEFQTGGYNFFKDGTSIGDFWSTADAMQDDGVEHKYRVNQVASGFEFYHNDTLLATWADSSPYTSGYMAFSTLDSTATIDDISGPILTEDFEGATVGSYPNSGAIGGTVWSRMGGAGTVEIEQLGYPLTVTTASFSCATTNVDLRIDRGSTVPSQTYTVSANNVGLLKDSLMTASTASYAASANSVALLADRIASATAASYSVSSPGIGLLLDRILPATSQSYSVDTNPVVLTDVPPKVWEPLVITTATYTVESIMVIGRFDPIFEPMTYWRQKGRR